jgi:hypothetical protein
LAPDSVNEKNCEDAPYFDIGISEIIGDNSKSEKKNTMNGSRRSSDITEKILEEGLFKRAATPVKFYESHPKIHNDAASKISSDETQ